jgi:serine/threonine protein kinase
MTSLSGVIGGAVGGAEPGGRDAPQCLRGGGPAVPGTVTSSSSLASISTFDVFGGGAAGNTGASPTANHDDHHHRGAGPSSPKLALAPRRQHTRHLSGADGGAPVPTMNSLAASPIGSPQPKVKLAGAPMVLSHPSSTTPPRAPGDRSPSKPQKPQSLLLADAATMAAALRSKSSGLAASAPESPPPPSSSSAKVVPWGTNPEAQRKARGSLPRRARRSASSVIVSRGADDTRRNQKQPAPEVDVFLGHDEDSVMYIQMELCELHTLRDLLRIEDRVVDAATNLRGIREITSGLEHIHELGLVHRDLTPANIFVTSSHALKIGDFGLVKDTNTADAGNSIGGGGGGGGDAGSTSGQTATSVASSYLNGSAHHHHHHHHGHHRRSVRSKSDTTGIGTPIYMAPEQRHGGRHSAKVDIYSLGVIVFECFHPFNTASERIITLQRLREGRMPAEVEPKIAKLVEWMMSPDASERPSAREILGCAILGGIGDPLRLATPSLTPLMADSGSGSGLVSGSTAMRRHSTMPTSSSTTAMTMSGELPREIGGGEQPDEHVARSDPLLLRGETRDN